MNARQDSLPGCAITLAVIVGIGVLSELARQSSDGPATTKPFQVPDLSNLPKPLEVPKFDFDPPPSLSDQLGSLPLPATTTGTGTSGNSRVQFDNRSGQPALVRLVGPTQAEVQVPHGERGAVSGVAAGHYVIRVRYGEPGNYHYSEGDAFQVDETATSYSEIEITLHRVAHGNYGTRAIGPADFAAAAPK